LEPSGVAHLLIASLLSKVWNLTLELSIGSKEVQNFLLPVQIIGIIGIQVDIEISHEDRGIAIGGVLIEGMLDMIMEVIKSFLLW